MKLSSRKITGESVLVSRHLLLDFTIAIFDNAYFIKKIFLDIIFLSVCTKELYAFLI